MVPGFRRAKDLPGWRKLALGTWGAPTSPVAYGVLDLECERAIDWLARLRQATGEKATLTHLVGKAAASAMATLPEANGFASFGRLKLRQSVDVFFQVAFFDDGEHPAREHDEPRRGANLAGAKIEHVDDKTVGQIAGELRERSRTIRQRGEDPTVRATRRMASLPGPLRSLGARAGAFLSFDVGLDLSRAGIPFDPFGSCMVTNVGVFGIELGWAPLIPYSRTPVVLTLGAIRDAPTVIGSEVVVRKRVAIGVAFDHRVMDGYHAGVMGRRFREIFADPASVLGEPGL